MRAKTQIRKKIQIQSLFVKLVLWDFEIIGQVIKYNFLPLCLYLCVCVQENQIVTLKDFYFFSITYQKTGFSKKMCHPVCKDELYGKSIDISTLSLNSSPQACRFFLSSVSICKRRN